MEGDMEESLVKIKLFLMIGFGIVFLEILIGSVSLGAGYLFREYDRELAEETLAIISETDPASYELLTDESDPSYREEFDRIYTTKGNRTVIAYGIVLIALSLLTLIPLIPVYHLAASQINVGGEETNTEEEDKKTEEEDKKEEKEKKNPQVTESEASETD